VSQNYNFAYHI